MPDITPVAGWILGGIAIFLAVIIGGSVSGAWETVLLWINQVPFSPTASVTDPIFNRDISFFLFELPFLRLIQGLFNGISSWRRCSWPRRATWSRPRTARLVFSAQSGFTSPSSARCSSCRSPSATSSVKLELCTFRGVATGVAYTDQNAQFVAFDLLTAIYEAGYRVPGRQRVLRMLWPLGLTIAFWFFASLVIGVYPEAIQRFTVVPNQFAQEERYIGNNIAMTRLAYDLTDWQDIPFEGEADAHAGRYRPRGGHVQERSPVGLPAAPDDGSTSCRRSVATTTSPTSTPTATSSTGSSAR